MKYNKMKNYSRETAKLFVGKGWHGLIDEAFDILETLPDVLITDVKEKYGELCVYYFGDRQDDIYDICRKSITICEYCGKPGKPRDTSWIKTLCAGCYEKEKTPWN